MANSTCYGIIADDLTGATDAAVPFAQRGFRTQVALRRSHSAGLNADVLALTTNSRHDSAALARRKALAACEFLRRHGAVLLYKKMDSTVQGNIVAETEALRVAGGFRTALVCPANPAQGRVVHQGILEVRGKHFAHLGEHFAAQGLSRFGVAQSPVTAAKVSRILEEGHPFVLADSNSEHDLAVLVRAALAAPFPVLLAGSAGMAAQLAKGFRMSGRRTRPINRASTCIPAPGAQHRLTTLIFCGTNNPVTLRQLAHLGEATRAPVVSLTDRVAKSIRSQLFLGPLTIQVPIHRKPDAVILQRLASLRSLFAERRIGSLLLTGGDTASLVCRWLGARGILLLGELGPGLPWGNLVGGIADGLAVCTKPGGFGDDDSLVNALRAL